MDIAEAIKHCREKACNTDCGREHEQLAEWLEELQRYKERAWISVKDRLPEKKGIYVVLSKTCDIVYYDCLNWTGEAWECAFGSKVTHWMPLPEPPEGSKYGR